MDNEEIRLQEIILSDTQHDMLGTATAELVSAIKQSLSLLQRSEKEEPIRIGELNGLYNAISIANAKIGNITLAHELEEVFGKKETEADGETKDSDGTPEQEATAEGDSKKK